MKNDQDSSLKARLNPEILKKMQETKLELIEIEKRKAEEEEARQREVRKSKEKNKSFEELLNESNLDWKKFK
ncbi:YqkE family protein [Bacillus litorisediminis]|uniref:YqkE family protein n=1 Tax=Bacillus litorisediminis TaxID=2922713 RepID=UPI001FAF3C70|nr:YqkE family protein [Bacillus litorisediminis]